MKRFYAATFGISVIAAMLTSATPANAVGSIVTGSVSNGTSSVASGTVEYYATCDDFDGYNPADVGALTVGLYAVEVPDGTYRVRITPDAGQGAVDSWHNAKTTCDDADLVTVSGNGTRNLVARAGFNVTGALTSPNGGVSGGELSFYTSCRAYRNHKATASVQFSGGFYMITVPAGTYYALIEPSDGSGAVRSWHEAQSTCSSATPVVINGHTVGMALRTVAGVNLSGTIRSSWGPVTNGVLEFYATCEDYQDNNTVGQTYPSSGTYGITLPAGTYRVRYTAFTSSDGALTSWHNASADCAGATAITVSGSPGDTENLIARAGALVAGTVTRTGGGTLTGGSVSFYENCRAADGGRSVAFSWIQNDGSYFAAMPPGTYVVEISPDDDDGALRSFHNGVTACQQATVVTVSAGMGTHDVVAAPGYVLTGSVSSSRGPVQDGYVYFQTDCDGDTVASATIDSGRYTASLPAGTYVARIEPYDSHDAVASWHNAKASCETASRITVNGNASVDLVTSSASHVTGHPTSANGPIGYGTVYFYATCDDYTTEESVAASSVMDGEYSTTIPNGTYRVLIEPYLESTAVKSWHHAAPSCEQAQGVTVTGDGTIDPVAATGTHLTGAVTSSSGTVSSGSVFFYPSCQAYQDWEASGAGQIRKGQYSTWLPAGTYRVRIQPDTDTAATSWHNAKNGCAIADVITVGGASMSQGLVASAGVDVTGLVTKGGQPVSFGSAVFYATCQDFLADQPSGEAMIEDGYYTLTLAPGSYRVLISVMGRNGEKYSWHSATGTCAGATPITVSGSTTANLVARTTSTVTGSVSSPIGLLANGWLEFYATCQDYQDRNAAAFAPFEVGEYTAGLPDGTYLARIYPYGGAAVSWHNAATGCATATAITVAGTGTHNVVAARGALITGGISSSAGPVKEAGVEFFTDCQAFYRSEHAGSGHATKGVYSLFILPGTYRVLIRPNKGTGARESWHAAKATCETADLVTVTGDGQINLVALPKTAPVVPPPPPPPGPPPSVLSGQTAKRPPKSVKKGKKVKLAKKTTQGTKVTWKSTTKRVCTVKKYVLTAKKRGACKISAKAPATPTFTAFAKRYTIRVK